MSLQARRPCLRGFPRSSFELCHSLVTVNTAAVLGDLCRSTSMDITEQQSGDANQRKKSVFREEVALLVSFWGRERIKSTSIFLNELWSGSECCTSGTEFVFMGKKNTIPIFLK